MATYQDKYFKYVPPKQIPVLAFLDFMDLGPFFKASALQTNDFRFSKKVHLRHGKKIKEVTQLVFI